MKQDFTYIAVVLDRSGSMSLVQQQTINNFNEFVTTQALVPGDARLRLAQFDNEYEIVFDRPLGLVEPLTHATFVPRGGTALLDAIGQTIDDLGIALKSIKEKDRPGKVIVAILTDGEENSSHRYTRQKVAAMVKHQREKYNWLFVFMGATEDAVTIAESYGMLRGQAIYYDQSMPGAYKSVTTASSNLMSAFRTTGTIGAFTSTDRTASAGIGDVTFTTIPNNTVPTSTSTNQTDVDQDESTKQGAKN